MEKGWKNYLLYTSIVLFIGSLIYILVETINRKNTGFETKTLWDWMDLLIVPLVLAGGAFYLNRSERNTEREIATDRQQEAALQTYFDKMSELLLKENLRTTEKAEVRDVARTRTLSIMRVLNARRNQLIYQFLYEAKLITEDNSLLNNAQMEGINLQGLKLNNANLSGANLSEANLSEANLSNANLSGANLSMAKLLIANLSGANLSMAKLLIANLKRANLSKAKLSGANLSRANLSTANLSTANLSEANLVLANLSGAYLPLANLGKANLSEANLSGANLSKANLSGANLSKANLSGANLSNANLSEAVNITYEQIKNIKSLKGAIMPDGKKYE